MSAGVSAWLDRAARHLAGDAGRERRSQPGLANPAISDARSAAEEHMSRGSAVKLGAAAGASLVLGLWRAPEAEAFTRDECIGQCYGGVLKRSLEGQRFCRNFYANPWKTDPKTWGRVREVIDEGGWNTLKKIIQDNLQQACETAVANKAVRKLDECDQACNIACGRSLQGRSSRRQVCKPPPPPPPKSYTPAPPAAPSVTEDPCWACTQVGGQCCGPFKAGADGRFAPCACANPSLGCERYGCGG
jgi:hypothetical protein